MVRELGLVSNFSKHFFIFYLRYLEIYLFWLNYLENLRKYLKTGISKFIFLLKFTFFFILISQFRLSMIIWPKEIETIQFIVIYYYIIIQSFPRPDPIKVFSRQDYKALQSKQFILLYKYLNMYNSKLYIEFINQLRLKKATKCYDELRKKKNS